MGFWAAFLQEPSLGVVWAWPTGRVNILFGFSHNQGVWVKQRLVAPAVESSIAVEDPVESRSRTRLRIAASIAFLFCACFKGF